MPATTAAAGADAAFAAWFGEALGAALPARALRVGVVGTGDVALDAGAALPARVLRAGGDAGVGDVARDADAARAFRALAAGDFDALPALLLSKPLETCFTLRKLMCAFLAGAAVTARAGGAVRRV